MRLQITNNKINVNIGKQLTVHLSVCVEHILFLQSPREKPEKIQSFYLPKITDVKIVVLLNYAYVLTSAAEEGSQDGDKRNGREHQLKTL